MSNAIVPQKKDIVIFQDDALDKVIGVLLYSLSETSERQYKHTFSQWRKFCADNSLSPMEMSADNLIAFFEAAGLSRSTKQNRLSHLRKFLQVLSAAYPEDSRIKSMYESAKLLKIKMSAEEKSAERPKNSLKPIQVFEIFDVWNEPSKLHTRNRALLAVLLYAGLRRSEVAALQWTDIDFDNELIHVRHGKGDKGRQVPFLSNIEQHLREWKSIIGERKYVFCAFRKGDHLDKDKPMSDASIYKILVETGKSKKLNIDSLSPHDMRRTLITNALANGVSVADMQFIAGHSRPETTLLYAQVKDAQEVKGRVKNKIPY